MMWYGGFCFGVLGWEHGIFVVCTWSDTHVYSGKHGLGVWDFL